MSAAAAPREEDEALATCPQLPPYYTRPPTAIVIVAKCPIPGRCKTRLSKTGLLNDEGCATMARAMLCDVIAAIHSRSRDDWKREDNIVKFLYFAAPSSSSSSSTEEDGEINNDDGRKIMNDVFASLNINDATIDDNHDVRTGIPDQPCYNRRDDADLWQVLPMIEESGGKGLRSSDLGAKLSDILVRTRTILREIYTVQLANGSYHPPPQEDDDDEHLNREEYAPSVAFVGMDSPELPLSEIAYALKLGSGNEHRKAYVSPSHDGGYGMVCLPSDAKPTVFDGIRWSDPLTAVSQIKAITDDGIDVELGSLMRDIDEPEDLLEFAERLSLLRLSAKSAGGSSSSSSSGDDVARDGHSVDVLSRPPPGQCAVPQEPNVNTHCQHSWNAMVELGIIDEETKSVIRR